VANVFSDSGKNVFLEKKFSSSTYVPLCDQLIKRIKWRSVGVGLGLAWMRLLTSGFMYTYICMPPGESLTSESNSEIVESRSHE
jgi:hypothetical protein